MKLSMVMTTLSTDAIGLVPLNLMFSRPLKCFFIFLQELLLLATAVAIATFTLSIEIGVKILRWPRVVSKSEV
jgi:hypothetical protein